MILSNFLTSLAIFTVLKLAKGWQSPCLARRPHTAVSITAATIRPDDSAPLSSRRQRKRLWLEGKQVGVISRNVPITPDWNVTVWEREKLASVVNSYWVDEQQGRGEKVLDPFGLVSWPGSVIAAQELMRHSHMVKGKRVLVLGAGVGIEAQAAAQQGAASVLATDIHPVTLKLLEYGAHQSGLAGNIITTAPFDIVSSEALPGCDLMIVADVLYNENLAAQVARRCLEARSIVQSPPAIFISDSQRFVRDFVPDLNAKMLAIGQPGVAWSSRELPAFTGSGVMIDEDQTYDVNTRFMWIGLEQL